MEINGQIGFQKKLIQVQVENAMFVFVIVFLLIFFMFFRVVFFQRPEMFGNKGKNIISVFFLVQTVIHRIFMEKIQHRIICQKILTEKQCDKQVC